MQTLDEVGFVLMESAEAVSTQHLQHAEKHIALQPLPEGVGIGHLSVTLCGFAVDVDHLSAQRVGIVGRCLPKERCHIVVYRAASSALEVDKLRLSVGREDDVACLKVAVHESLWVVAGLQVGYQLPELGLQRHLVELHAG